MTDPRGHMDSGCVPWRWVVVGLVAVAGCGTNPPDPFPEVTEAMRQACAPFDYSDAEMAALISGMELLRDLGATKEYLVADLATTCTFECFTCTVLFIEAVYE